MSAGDRRNLSDRHSNLSHAERHPALFEERRAAWLREKQLPLLKRSYLLQLAIFIVLLAIWQLPIINPIKLLVVVFHEMSHVIAGYATGASIFGMAIDPGGAGVTLGMGGNQLVIVAAGYLGSFLVGYLLYALSAVWSPIEVWLVLCGLAGGSMFMGWLNDFTRAFGFGSMVLLGIGAVALSDAFKLFVLRIIGTACCLYPVIDVAGEFFSAGQDGFMLHGRPIGSDAQLFSQLSGIPVGLVATFWIVSALSLLGVLVPWSARKEAATEVRRGLIQRAESRARKLPPKYDPSDPRSIPEYTIR